MKILEQEILFNFMSQEAFNTIQHAKAAFIGNPPSTMGSVFLMLAVLALIVYGINRSRRK